MKVNFEEIAENYQKNIEKNFLQIMEKFYNNFEKMSIKLREPQRNPSKN